MNFLRGRRSTRNPEGRPRGRPPHPDILTPAEWRVLEEVRQGHTNTEIADRTGLSFNTVKTHISNMLIKTGTRDRQELARWHGEPTEASRARLVRGFALPLAGWSMGAKVAGGVVAAAVFLGAVWVVFTELGGGEEPPAVSAWTLADGGLYLETTWQLSHSSIPRTPPPGLPDDWDAGPRPDNDRVEQLTLWWNGRDEWRAELTSQSSRVSGAEHRIVVGNADVVSQYDVLRHTISDVPASEFWERYFPPWTIPISAALEEHDSVDDYMEYLSTHPERHIREMERTRAGAATHLGRTVEVIETDDGGRTLIEPDTMLMVLSESPGFLLEVTEIETEQAFDPQLFVFDPPADAGQIARGGPEGLGCASGPDTTPVAGFLALEYAPDGWETGGDGHGRSSGPWQPHCDVWFVNGQMLPEDGDGYVWLEQLNLVHIPEHLRSDTPIDVAGHEGYRITGDGLEQLVWAQNNVVAMLESDVLPFEELLRIAESAELIR